MLDLLMVQYLAAQQLVSTTEPATTDLNPIFRSTGALHLQRVPLLLDRRDLLVGLVI